METQDEKQLQEALGQMEEQDELRRQEEMARQNKMGTMPIGPLLVNMSVPIVLSMIVQALYNVVDSIFVARLGEDALAAVGFIFPIQNLMLAVSVGTAVGVNSLLSRRLGEKNVKGANSAAVNGLFVTLLSWLAFAVFGLLCSGWYMGSYAQGPDVHPDLIRWGVDYMQIVTVGAGGLFFSITLERLLQATGRSLLSMVSQMTGAIINIILDPIMIYGLLGFPALGVAGAAWATIIGQFGSMLVAIWLNVAFNKDIQMRFRGFRPNGRTIRNIYKVGLPSIVMQSIGSVMTFAVNKILIAFGTTAVSVFNVYFKLQSFVVLPVLGFNNGMVPIVAFNYGARNPKRIEQTVRRCVVIGVGIMLLGTALFWLVPGWMMRLFNAQDNMMEMGIAALRIISIGFPLAGVSIVFSGMFQAVGQGLFSLAMSAIRQLVVLVPVAWLLAGWKGLPALWYAFPIAEVFCTVCAVLSFFYVWRKNIRPLGQPV